MSLRILTPLFVGASLVVIAAVGRVAPHPPNFVPVAAAAMFAGFYFRHRATALIIPLVSVAISDLAIGGYDWRVMAVVYAGLAWPALLRPFLRTPSVRRVVGCSLVSSTIFYLASNAAVWAFSPMYAPSMAGLIACYAAALPFLAYTALGDLIWSGFFFGTYAISKNGMGRAARWDRSAIVCSKATQ
jgi:hypothetical protein